MGVAATNQAEIVIQGVDGTSPGTVKVSLLPKHQKDISSQPDPLLDLRLDPNPQEEVEPVQLLEGLEYHYEFKLDPKPPEDIVISTTPSGLFESDTTQGLIGRLKPGLNVGTIPVTLTIASRDLGIFSFEVRSRKFDYLSHYQWMLRDIAEEFTELLMAYFAPSVQRFEIEEGLAAKTLYQRFAFLQSLLNGDLFEAAIHQILARPHHIWAVETEYRSPGQRIPSTSKIARQIVRPGPKEDWPDHPIIQYVPRKIQVERTENSLDTPPNRFVKFALTRWRDAVSEIERLLSQMSQSATVERGCREAGIVLDKLDALLSEELFRDVGPLTYFPADNQVLQKREGYRDIFLAYIQFEAAARLAWEGGDNVYDAGKRDVAALYEYWTYFQLAKIISELAEIPLDYRKLIIEDDNKLQISLRKGSEAVLSGQVERCGRKYKLDLYYNKTFSHGIRSESWTRQMIPDCSLRISPDKCQSPPLEDIWLHFDAKYRVDNLKQIFGEENEGEETQEFNEEPRGPQILGEAKRDDLLKMHAYRDAIKRSAGSYVLYPGDSQQKEQLYKEYHEILPGLGAFTLLPSEYGIAEGVDLLTNFIDDVITHMSTQISQHERGRFWLKEAHAEYNKVEEKRLAVPQLELPPADTKSLIGYVKSPAHLEWILHNKLYNVRADDRPGSLLRNHEKLSAKFVILYGAHLKYGKLFRQIDEPEEYTKDDLIEIGYPDPGGELYYCLHLGPIDEGDWPEKISSNSLMNIRHKATHPTKFGEPFVLSLSEVLKVRE